MRYMGGKSRIAKKIAPHLLTSERPHYCEPFVGGGAVLCEVARSFQTVTAFDNHRDLINLYRAVQVGWVPPETITEQQYNNLRNEPSSPLRTFAGFGASYGGKWWGGFARARKETRDYAAEWRRSLLKAQAVGMFDPHVHFAARSFFDLIPEGDLSRCVIYCDPPYSGTTGYTTGQFDHPLFWKTLQGWAERGAEVFVSEYTAPSTAELVASFTPTTSLKGTGNVARSRDNLYRVGK